MDYYQSMRSDYIHQAMYPVDHRVDYFPKNTEASKVKIEPKAPCVPSFVTRIEGNAVEEGARVFFEGIVDAQPNPVFTWLFEDEKIVPGRPGWEEAEVHNSKKMSTLILKYTREHHMGKYSLLAQNRLGTGICSCDLIVRKKQFPPVFWKRLTDLNVDGGCRYVLEVEVGGWPTPDVFWYKDDELVYSRIITENYNGYFNAYVPEKNIDVVQIDQIRHAIVFNKLSESDTGKYTVFAQNPLGEAVCEAEFEVIEDDNIKILKDLYIPELWKTGKRLTWKDEDSRPKKFVGIQEPELTPEDIRDMTRRVASTPLPKSLEYLASLPKYESKGLKGLLPMPFKPDRITKEQQQQEQQRRRNAIKLSQPSKFVPGKIEHHGYRCDDGDKLPPIWINPADTNPKNPNDLRYDRIRFPHYPTKDDTKSKEVIKGPPCPHEWESHETIEALYKLLDQMKKESKERDEAMMMMMTKMNKNKMTTNRKQSLPTSSPSQTRKKTVKFAKSETDSAKREWEERLNKNEAGARDNARDFTTEFMKELREPPPQHRKALSPTESVEEESSAASTVKEFIPVKEKVKMIAQQNEEIVKKEEKMKDGRESPYVPGGVRILPPSPITTLKEEKEEEEEKRPVVLEDKYDIEQNFQDLVQKSSEFSSQFAVQHAYETSSTTVQTTTTTTSSTFQSSVQQHQRESLVRTSQESFGYHAEEEEEEGSQEESITEKKSVEAYEACRKSFEDYSAKQSSTTALAKSSSYSAKSTVESVERVGYSAPSTPKLNRRFRDDEDTKPKKHPSFYRNPPSSPFQPSFYRPPPEGDPLASTTAKPFYKQARKFTKKRPKNVKNMCSDSDN